MATATKSSTNGVKSAVLQDIEIPRIDVQTLEITLIGDSELICHRWSEKAKKEMLDKQTKQAKTAKEAKDPHRDFFESLYWLTPMPDAPLPKEIPADARFGFPAVAFKATAVSACRFADGMRMTEARGAFHVNGEFVEIQSHTPAPAAASPPTIREDMVRIGMGVADIRYRGGFRTWRASLSISYNASVFSPAQIINLFNLAGFGVGVGEWRPERDGPYGRFHVASEAEL